MMSGGRVTAEGRAMMEQLMQSGKIAEVLTGMMTMVRNMGGGDSMTGMVRMMKMMEQMQDQMKQMHGQMTQMKQMHEQMTQMKQMHEQMTGMMQQHRAEMQKVCPGAAAPDPTKKGG